MQLRAKLLLIVHVSQLMHNLLSELYNVLARTAFMTPAMHRTHHQMLSHPLFTDSSQAYAFYKTFLNHYFSLVSFNIVNLINNNF